MKIFEILTESEVDTVETVMRRLGFIRQSGGPVGSITTLVNQRKKRKFEYQRHAVNDSIVWWRVTDSNDRVLISGKDFQSFKDSFGLNETASAGSTSAGSIASVSNQLEV